MWSRVIEIMLGCWLLVSPFVFGHSADESRLWVVDLSAGALVIVCGLLSYVPICRYAHLATLATSLGLIVFAVAASEVLDRSADATHAAAALQNQVVLGLLLMMLAVVPNAATHPPRSWAVSTAENESGLFEY